MYAGCCGIMLTHLHGFIYTYSLGWRRPLHHASCQMNILITIRSHPLNAVSREGHDSFTVDPPLGKSRFTPHSLVIETQGIRKIQSHIIYATVHQQNGHASVRFCALLWCCGDRSPQTLPGGHRTVHSVTEARLSDLALGHWVPVELWPCGA